MENWLTEKWWVSHLNFLEEVRKNYNLPKKVLIHDITLRDGEQQAGIIFNKDDKIKIATMLDEVGVNRIEAGMPAVSKHDEEAVKAIANLGLNAKVFCFARCMKRDVDLALKCDVDGVEMEIPSSEHLIKYAYGWPLEKAIELSVETTRYAAEHGLHVAFFTIDGTRADLNWWFKIVDKVATEGHMDSLVLVDTFGVCNPDAIRYLVRRVREHFNKPIEVHFHNDFGLAVANTLAAVTEGAEVIHTTVNGIGERMGNADLAEVTLALEALYGVKLDLKYNKLYELSKLVEKLSGIKMPPNKPVVGDGVFRVESGIIAGWWMNLEKQNKPLIMFPYSWDLVGQKGVEIILGKKSGRDSIIKKLNEMKIDPSKVDVDKILERVKEEAIKRKTTITDEIFKQIVEEVKGTSP
ncbi:MAG: pyruvate carboxyltransferase [Nitrososphaerota archaeon]|nr:pyruvate carboxyltransferase [Nitrososphaerota archaeon]